MRRSLSTCSPIGGLLKILVTGATGFIGRKLTSALVSKGHEVLGVSRNAEKARKELSEIESWFDWSALENGALRGIDAIVHLAGESVAAGRWTEEQKKRIRESRTGTTRRLIEAIKKAGPSGPRIFVGASAIGIYGDRGEEELTEASGLGQGFLAEVCRDWEALAQMLEPSLRVAVLRLGMVLGHGGGALSRLEPLFSSGFGGRIGSGKQWVSWVHVDDVVNAFLWVLTTDGARGAYNVTAPGSVRNLEFSKLLAHQLGKPASMAVPKFALKLVMGEMAEIVLDSQNVRPERLLREKFQFTHVELKTALEALYPKGYVVAGLSENLRKMWQKK